MVPRHHCLLCRCRHPAGEQGTGDDAAASSPALSAIAVAIARQAMDTLLVAATAAALFVATAAATLPLHSHHSSRLAATSPPLRHCHSSWNVSIALLPQQLRCRHSRCAAGCHSSCKGCHRVVATAAASRATAAALLSSRRCHSSALPPQRVAAVTCHSSRVDAVASLRQLPRRCRSPVPAVASLPQQRNAATARHRCCVPHIRINAVASLSQLL
jgi:hypothetical protein